MSPPLQNVPSVTLLAPQKGCAPHKGSNFYQGLNFSDSSVQGKKNPKTIFWCLVTPKKP